MNFENIGLLTLLRDYVRVAWENKEPPRMHGNGFIQLDINPITRLNFWHPDFPRQDVDTGWHDHTFSFTSLCLRGKLYNLIYVTKEHEQGLFNAYIAQQRNGEDTELVKQSKRYNLNLKNVVTVTEGSSYSMRAFDTHRSETKEPTVTLLYKTSIQHKGDLPSRQPKATVYCPVGLTPDNKFQRNAFETSWLWEQIHMLLTKK